MIGICIERAHMRIAMGVRENISYGGNYSVSRNEWMRELWGEGT